MIHLNDYHKKCSFYRFLRATFSLLCISMLLQVQFTFPLQLNFWNAIVFHFIVIYIVFKMLLKLSLLPVTSISLWRFVILYGMPRYCRLGIIRDVFIFAINRNWSVTRIQINHENFPALYLSILASPSANTKSRE